MSDLPNSTRTLHKATYVPIQAREREARQLQGSGRAFQKLNLLRALAPTTAELKGLRSSRGERSSRPASATQARVVGALLRAQETDALNALEAAKELAAVDANDLLDVADSIVAERKRTGALVADTLRKIRRRIDERADAPERDISDTSLLRAANHSVQEDKGPVDGTAILRTPALPHDRNMAASWDSTTSGSSTAARLCPREGTWSRPTAPPGWPSCVPGGRAASATG